MLLSLSFDILISNLLRLLDYNKAELFYATFHFALNLCWLHAITMNKKKTLQFKGLGDKF